MQNKRKSQQPFAIRYRQYIGVVGERVVSTEQSRSSNLRPRMPTSLQRLRRYSTKWKKVGVLRVQEAKRETLFVGAVHHPIANEHKVTSTTEVKR